MMKKMWKMRKDKSAVSPVIATILMVAITVVLAAVLYVMVMGFGTGGSATSPTASLTKNGSSVSVTINPQTNSNNIGIRVTVGGVVKVPSAIGATTVNQPSQKWVYTQTNTGKVTTGDSLAFTTPAAGTIVQLVYMPSSSNTTTDLQVIGNAITF